MSRSTTFSIYSFGFRLQNYVRGILEPIFGLCVLVPNSIIVFVYLRQSRTCSRAKRSANILLVSTAIANTLTVTVPSPWYIYAYASGRVQEHVPFDLCIYWNLFEKVLPKTFHAIAVWLTMALAVQRSSALKYPIRANIWWTTKKVLRLVITMTLVSIALHSMEIADTEFYRDEILLPESNTTVVACGLTYKKWIGDNFILYELLWTTSHIVLCHFAPVCVLLVTDIFMIRLLKRSLKLTTYQSTEKKISKSKVSKTSEESKLVCNCKQTSNVGCVCSLGNLKRMRENRRLTILITIFTTTIACVEIPLGILVLTTSILMYIDRNIARDYILFGPTSSVVQFISFVCFPLMFVYSCFLNKQFRKTLSSFCSRRVKLSKRAGVSFIS